MNDSFKNNVLSTLLRYSAGSLQDIIKIPLGHAVLLARRRSLGRELDGVHLRPLHLDTGEGHPRTFDADRPLDGIKPRAGIDQPLHEPEVAAGYGFGRPQTDYQILHGQFGHAMEFSQLFQLIAKGHQMLWRKVLRPKQLLRGAPLFGSEELRCISNTVRQVRKRSWRTPNRGE